MTVVFESYAEYAKSRRLLPSLKLQISLQIRDSNFVTDVSFIKTDVFR